jgi:hypothetical protein
LHTISVGITKAKDHGPRTIHTVPQASRNER